MARVYAMTLGTADAETDQAQEEIRRFMERPLVVESAQGWEALDEALRDVYDRPTEMATLPDQDVRNDGWIHLFEAMGSWWNTRYEAALG
jgi:hypothetical protein